MQYSQQKERVENASHFLVVFNRLTIFIKSNFAFNFNFIRK